MLGRLKTIIGQIFDDYDPWEVKEWKGTQEEAERFEEYMDRYLITPDEVVTMSARAPF
jgi:hypothetical protein